MLKVILDTNIVISAALSQNGNCANVIGIITDDEQVQLFISEEILFEYEEVLSRKHLNIPDKVQKSIIKSIRKVGLELMPTPSYVSFSDESDRVFYDTAITADAILITGNKKHYPTENFIMTPAEFLQMLGK